MKLWQKKYFSPLVHLIVWALLIGVPAGLIRQESYLGVPAYFFGVTAVFHAGIFYLNAYYLYPKLLNRKFWWLYIISLVLVVFISYHIKLFALKLVPDFQLTGENRGLISFGIIPFLIASIIFRLVSDRIKFERLEKEARSEQLAAQLKFLRSQISPHFLFNMMTNMVSLARQKSDILEPSLIRLSELLRYMLYESQKDKIQFADEIEHIRNYTELQNLRFGDDVAVELRINTDNKNNLIEPMLLIPFIENAFKHGATARPVPYIHIDLTKTGNTLMFTVVNNYGEDEVSKDQNSGIGLDNVKNRLKLLYPGKYQLDINDRENVVAVMLKLDLA